MKKSKNYDLLQSLTTYCLAHPEERLWQALRNWSGFNAIFVLDEKAEDLKDTFYWENKNE